MSTIAKFILIDHSDKKQWVKKGGKRRQYEGDVPVSNKKAGT